MFSLILIHTFTTSFYLRCSAITETAIMSIDDLLSAYDIRNSRQQSYTMLFEHSSTVLISSLHVKVGCNSSHKQTVIRIFPVVCRQYLSMLFDHLCCYCGSQASLPPPSLSAPSFILCPSTNHRKPHRSSGRHPLRRQGQLLHPRCPDDGVLRRPGRLHAALRLHPDGPLTASGVALDRQD